MESVAEIITAGVEAGGDRAFVLGMQEARAAYRGDRSLWAPLPECPFPVCADPALMELRRRWFRGYCSELRKRGVYRSLVARSAAAKTSW